MKKNEYKRPLMIVENFVPNEFIATCWYVESGKCYSYLYHDVASVLGFGDPDKLYNPTQASHENMYYGNPHGSGEHRLPSLDDNPKWFRTDGPEVIPNDGKYYKGYNLIFQYTDNIGSSTPIYKISYNNKNHYFSEYKTDGNHS